MGKKDIPNIITCTRIVGAFALLFTQVFSSTFFIVYTFCGFTDILDGFLARRLNLSSELGAKLDSIADLLFYSALAVKIVPELCKELPLWLWCVGFTVIGLRLISYSLVAVKYRKFASLHTYMNKLSGLAIFIMPYFFRAYSVASCVVIGVVTSIATVEELLIHIFRRDYKADIHAISK